MRYSYTQLQSDLLFTVLLLFSGLVYQAPWCICLISRMIFGGDVRYHVNDAEMQTDPAV